MQIADMCQGCKCQGVGGITDMTSTSVGKETGVDGGVKANGVLNTGVVQGGEYS